MTDDGVDRNDELSRAALERAAKVRAEADARTDARQEELERGERRAAEVLRDNASAEEGAGEAARRAHERVAGARDDVERIADRARALQEETQRLRDRIRGRRIGDRDGGG